MKNDQKYLWIFQYASGVGLHQHEMQFLNLYPSKIGFLIGIANGLCGAGSFFPLAWKTLIEQEFISYSVIMWIWFGFSVISLILGTIIYPWHNLPQDLTEGRSLINLIEMYYDRLRIQIVRVKLTRLILNAFLTR